MADDDDTFCVISMPVTAGVPQIEGDHRGRCDECRVEVYLTDASMTLIREVQAMVLCWKCGMRRHREHPDESKVIGWSHEGVEQLRAGRWPFKRS